MFFGDVASAGHAVTGRGQGRPDPAPGAGPLHGRPRRRARGAGRPQPVGRSLAHLVPDALVADRSAAAEGGSRSTASCSSSRNERAESLGAARAHRGAPARSGGRSLTTRRGPGACTRPTPARWSTTSSCPGPGPGVWPARSAVTRSRTGSSTRLSVDPTDGYLDDCGPTPSRCADRLGVARTRELVEDIDRRRR